MAMADAGGNLALGLSKASQRLGLLSQRALQPKGVISTLSRNVNNYTNVLVSISHHLISIKAVHTPMIPLWAYRTKSGRQSGRTARRGKVVTTNMSDLIARPIPTSLIAPGGAHAPAIAPHYESGRLGSQGFAGVRRPDGCATAALAGSL
jgi:hypothetical protein